MLSNDIIENLKEAKKDFIEDGFVIDGVFGSFARGDFKSNSDIDLLYHLENTFFYKYRGFLGFKKLDEIKQTLSKKFNKKIDIAPIDNLSDTAKKYILKDVIYV